jgi:hypothetical protein
MGNTFGNRGKSRALSLQGGDGIAIENETAVIVRGDEPGEVLLFDVG